MDRSERQNPSGHIFMDTAMTGAFREMERKINRVNRQREYGLLKFKEERNPVLAQRTPRVDYRGYQFKPPPGRVEKEKWIYPESDWGLMSKFDSQKAIYDQIFEKQKNYEDEIAKFQKLKEQNEKKIQDELNRQAALEESRRNNMNLLEDDTPLINTDSVTPEGYQSYELMQLKEDEKTGEKKKVKTGQEKNHQMELLNKLLSKHDTKVVQRGSVYEYPASIIKTVHKMNPNVSAEWRAERAAKFVEKQRHHPLQAPTPRNVENGPFKVPRAIDRRRNSTNSSVKRTKVATGGNILDIPLDTLKQQLAQTEEEISRQQMKIGFRQPKRYG